MNGTRKYVVSPALATAEWNNSVIVKGDLAAEITKIKQEPGQDVLVAGSATLVQALLAHGLVDERRLEVYPLVLGKGKCLFGADSYTKLGLVNQQSTSTGVLLLTYMRA